MSHTDLNWNTVRYLQECEGLRSDITHLSLQLMPFPWFQVRQTSLYPHIVFPPLFDGVNTEQASEGNARLIVEFIKENYKNHSEIYVDLHAINDGHLDGSGKR